MTDSSPETANCHPAPVSAVPAEGVDLPADNLLEGLDWLDKQLDDHGFQKPGPMRSKIAALRAQQPVAVEPGMVKVGRVIQICEDAARERRKQAAEGGDEDQKRRWIAGAIQAEILSEKIRALSTTPLYPATPAAQVTGEVEVKPLEWAEVDEICTRLTAPALGGKMMIVELDPGSGQYSAGFDVGGLAFCFVQEVDPLGNGRQTRPAQYSSVVAAKAAAQADYEARIRAALTGGDA